MRNRAPRDWIKPILILMLSVALLPTIVAASSLDDLNERGVLRHLGVPYANFVTGAGDGMDVELMQQFAAWLRVGYEYVQTDWSSAIGDLTGENIKSRGGEPEHLGKVPIKGDVIANGMTVIPWRQQVVLFGEATFPTQVWQGDKERCQAAGTDDYMGNPFNSQPSPRSLSGHN